MKYTKEERLDIVKRVHDRELTIAGAAVKYGLDPSSVKSYLRLYRAETGLPPRINMRTSKPSALSVENPKGYSLKEYEAMSK